MTLLYEVTKGPTKDLQISHEGASTEMQKSNRGPTKVICFLGWINNVYTCASWIMKCQNLGIFNFFPGLMVFQSLSRIGY